MTFECSLTKKELNTMKETSHLSTKMLESLLDSRKVFHEKGLGYIDKVSTSSGLMTKDQKTVSKDV